MSQGRPVRHCLSSVEIDCWALWQRLKMDALSRGTCSMSPCRVAGYCLFSTLFSVTLKVPHTLSRTPFLLNHDSVKFHLMQTKNPDATPIAISIIYKVFIEHLLYARHPLVMRDIM